MPETILIVDDEEDIRLLIQGILEDEGYQTLSAATSARAIDIINQHSPDLVIQDIWLQGSAEDGLGILKITRESHPYLPFLMISGHSTIETAVSAIKLGAYDFIEKPFKSDRLLLMIRRAIENTKLKQQNARLRQQNKDALDSLFIQLPEQSMPILDKITSSANRAFITGELGTGKKIAAQYIHQQSERSHAPFVVLDCRQVNKNADKLHDAVIKAGAGTLVLEEVTSLLPQIQDIALKAAQKSTSCCIIATSSASIEDDIKAGVFNNDLFYRLNMNTVYLPPLRKRKADIPELISFYSSFKFTQAALERLVEYSWPGNIWHLRTVLDWLSIMHKDIATIDIDHLPPDLSTNDQMNHTQHTNESPALDNTALSLKLREAREHFERLYLTAQLERFEGNISKTAEFIGMERSALHRKLKSLDVFSDEKQNVA